ncbi:MAG: glycine--tRNA ligase [Spirochaetaceae bacterium]|nr:glycine--tRNA ligase [Spirochaetaceae bacterium]
MSNKKINPQVITNEDGASMEKLVSLCKRRGFVYQSSEIYGGLNGAWDYGPLGVELKNNIQKIWWQAMTRKHDNIVGIDGAIMMHPRVWEASGHVENFSDPLIDCKACKTRFRADHLEADNPEALKNKKCPSCGGELTEPRNFNLMFKTHLGPVDKGDDSGLVYLRPETAQAIFVNFKNVADTSRVSIPFGIAQVGKAFRNEITTKNFIFRTLEFEQMEMQFFCKPGTDLEWLAKWKEERLAYYHNLLGIKPERLRFHQHGANELAHYAADAYDIEYLYPFGWQELEGIHDRTDYDLRRHAEFSGNKRLTYQDEETKEYYIPYVIETSAGLTRSVLITLMDAYHEESLGKDDEGNEDIRTVLHFHPNVAPIMAGIFPLVKKDGLPEIAREIETELKEEFNVYYDGSGAVGRRYRRMDEVGTPYCITIDHQSKEDGSVTLRYRDTMQQVRLPKEELVSFIKKANKNYKRQ